LRFNEGPKHGGKGPKFVHQERSSVVGGEHHIPPDWFNELIGGGVNDKRSEEA